MEYKNLKSLKEHKAAIYALCQAEEEYLVFTAGSDRHVILWNLKTFTAEKVVAKAPTTIISLLYIKEFNYLLIGQIEGGVHVIDLELGKEVKYLKQHKGYVFDLKYLTTKKELVVSSGDGSISIWSLPDFRMLYQQQLCEEKIRKMDLSTDERSLALALGEGSIAILNTEDWSENNRVINFSSAVNSVRFFPEEGAILAGEKNAHLYKVDMTTSVIEQDLAAHNWAIYDIRFSPSAKFFATASRDKTVKIWDRSTMKVLKRFEGIKDQAHTHSVNVLLWSNFNNYLLSAGDDASLKVWQISED